MKESVLTLRGIAQQAQSLLQAETAVVALSESEGAVVYYAAAVGKHADAIVGKRGPAGTSGLCGATLESRCPILVKHPLEDARVRQDMVKALGIHSALAVPLRCGNRLVGALMVMNSLNGLPFDAEDEQQLTRYACEAAVQIYGTGQGMGKPWVEIVDYGTYRPILHQIRGKVFVEEQHVPAEVEVDALDPLCVHALAYYGSEPVGTGRLTPNGYIGRVAVYRHLRRRGIGREIMEQLIAIATQHNHSEVVLSAQCHAIDFYRKLGFFCHGPVYQEVGIDHIQMIKPLTAAYRPVVPVATLCA